MKMALFTTAFICISAPLAALTCNFTTECFEADVCGEGAFKVDIDFPNHIVTTEFGDLSVVAISKAPSLLTMLARGDGANYLLTNTKTGARLAVHMDDGPLMVNYVGTCE